MLQPLYFRVKIAAQPTFDRVEFADSFFGALEAHFINHPEVPELDANGRIITSRSVSYTHLTLPTIYSV